MRLAYKKEPSHRILCSGSAVRFSLEEVFEAGEELIHVSVLWLPCRADTPDFAG